MKKITSFALGLALLAGTALTAQAQIMVPKVSDDTNTYTYYLQNAGSNNSYYLTTTLGEESSTTNIVSFANSGTKLQVKLLASTESDGKYNVVATNLGSQTATYIGASGTTEATAVTYYTADAKQNADWTITATTHVDANGYYPLYKITTGSYGWNMYQGNQGKFVKLWDSTDQGCTWNFIPADVTTLKALATDIQADVETKSTTVSKDDVTTAITNANAVTAESDVESLGKSLLDAYGKFLFNISKVPCTNTTSATLEDGKAYTITSISATGRKCYMNYTSGTGYGLVVTTDADNSNYPETAKLICRKVSDGNYVFVNPDGKYFIFKGNVSGNDYGNNGAKGYLDSYDAECVVTLAAQNVSIVSYTSTLKQSLSCVYAKFAGYKNRVFVINYGADGTLEQPIYDKATNSTYFSTQYSSAFLIEDTSYPNTVTFNDASGIDNVEKIATFSAPFPTVIPTGVKAYYISGTDDTNSTATVTAVSGEAIPANTGVLLTAGTDATTSTMVPATTETIATISGNILESTAGNAKTIGENDNIYILAKSGDVVAFYKALAKSTLAMNKAYLPVSSTGGSAIAMNFGGSTTGIKRIVESASAPAAPIYDLTGRRVQQTVKGSLYIQGGHKFIAQ